MSPKIFSIVYQPAPSEYEEPYQFNRVRVKSAELIADHGIKGDRKAGRAKKRQLNVMSCETLEKLKANGYKTGPGEMGEQIIIEGIEVTKLERGTRLQFGNNAIIELAMPRTGCEWFEVVQGQTKEIDLGMMAMVIESGIINEGDDVVLLDS